MSEDERLTDEDRFLLTHGVAGSAQGEKAVRIIDHLEACNEQLRIGDYETRRETKRQLEGLQTRVIFLENRLEQLLSEHGQVL